MSFTLLTVALLLPGSDPQPDAATATAQSLDGAWKVLLEQKNGHFWEEESYITIADNWITQHHFGSSTNRPCRANLSRGWIDISLCGVFYRGIYRWDGPQLMICCGLDSRPTEFSAPKGSGRWLYVLEPACRHVPFR